MPSINRVYQLRIETLSPLCVLSGSRLYEQVDFYADRETTYVFNSDAVLDLVLQRWLERQPSREQQLARLAEREERLQRRKQKNIEDIKRFEASPPKDPRKAQEMEQRLIAEANKIKEELARLKAERPVLKRQRPLSLSRQSCSKTVVLTTCLQPGY